MSFVFFDTETTGLLSGFDQIVQFAAVRTDANLNELERFDIRSQLQRHVVPHPSAVHVTGLTMDDYRDPDQPSHYQMVRQIRAKLLSWSPGIFLGYNSIRFDEEMLRHALYQTLHPPYLTSNHGNGRMDVLSLALAASALSPGCLQVPLTEEGKPTYKLDCLAPQNGFAHDRAHDAMADVNAALHICRLVRDRAPDVWNRFVRFSKKAAVADFIDQEDGCLLTEFYGNEPFHTAIACLGPHPSQSQTNVRLCLNLAVDLDWLTGLDAEDLKEVLRRKPSPVRRIRVNACPALTALYDVPDDLLGGLTFEHAEGLAQRVKSDPNLRAKLVSAYTDSEEEWPPSPHVEKQLYDDFIPNEDEPRMQEFHAARWPDRFEIVERFTDPRLRTLGYRLILAERPAHLPDDIRLGLERELVDRLLASDKTQAPWTTLPEATEQCGVLLQGLDEERGAPLRAYKQYLADRSARVTAYRQQRFGTA